MRRSSFRTAGRAERLAVGRDCVRIEQPTLHSRNRANVPQGRGAEPPKSLVPWRTSGCGRCAHYLPPLLRLVPPLHLLS